MTFAPPTLSALAQLWTSRGGSNLGIVGSFATHCGGYHLGRDRIYSACACKPGGVCRAGRAGADYSVADFPGRDGGIHCTNAAAAIDLGPIAGLAGAEVSLARWLIRQCQAGAPDTADIRAVNFQTYRWDRARGQASAIYVHSVNETGHAHLEWFRDAEGRDHTAAVRRWLAIAFGRKVVCSGGYLWSGPNASSSRLIPLPAGTTVELVSPAAVAGGAWSFGCNGASRSGTDWFHVIAAGVTGYVAAGRLGS